MRARSKSILIPVIFCVAFIIIFLTCHLEVFARQNSFSAGLDICESNYRSSLSASLKSEGIKNAGITISKMMTDGSNIKYKVEIYLPSYIELNSSEEAALAARLSTIDLGVDNATVSITFFRERG